MPQVQLLAVSGGGENGAFGAGLFTQQRRERISQGQPIVPPLGRSMPMARRANYRNARSDPGESLPGWTATSCQEAGTGT